MPQDKLSDFDLGHADHDGVARRIQADTYKLKHRSRMIFDNCSRVLGTCHHTNCQTLP